MPAEFTPTSEMTSKRVAVLGLGLIGKERLHALQQMSEADGSVEVIATLDPLVDLPISAPAYQRVGDLDELLRLDPDLVVIAVPHDCAGELTERCLKHGTRVLVEKPLGRNASEARSIAAHASSDSQLHVGFTYRFFTGLRELINDTKDGRFGDPISVSMVLGHGGSPGDEASWKLDPQRAGGGCLIDPGVHLLDLAQLLLGTQLRARAGRAWRGFWGTGVEEDVHLLLQDDHGTSVNLQISVVRWRSTFRVEVHGTDGYGIVEGRGRSYGPQRYRRGERWGWRVGGSQAESETLVSETDGANVLRRELEALIAGGDDAPGPCTAAEAVSVMELLDDCRGVALDLEMDGDGRR